MNPLVRFSRRATLRATACLLMAAIAAGTVASNAPARRFETKIIASDGRAPDFFGKSVALDGTSLVVGAFGEGTGGRMAGAAYVYDWNPGAGDWSASAKLLAHNRESMAKFGTAVSLDEDRVLVGATGTDNNRGSAYLFTRGAGGAWDQQVWLRPARRFVEGGFGSAVALRGPLAAVGAPGGREHPGSVHIFTGTSSSREWKEISALSASPSSGATRFGSSLALGRNMLVVGAEGSDSAPGAVFVFRWTAQGWIEESLLRAPDSAPGDRFGCSVSLEGDSLVIGALGAQSRMGAVYVFSRNPDGWQLEAELRAPNGAPGDMFGRSVAHQGPALVIGAEGANAATGSIYVFGRSGNAWNLFTQVTPADGEPGDQFGGSVAVLGSLVAVGSSTDNGGRGSTYVYDFTPPG
jgi:hypothetical protein